MIYVQMKTPGWLKQTHKIVETNAFECSNDEENVDDKTIEINIDACVPFQVHSIQ